jgi:hypothetical protein
MIKVRLADKNIVLNFPDDMPENEIRDAINKNFYSDSPETPASPELPQGTVGQWFKGGIADLFDRYKSVSNMNTAEIQHTQANVAPEDICPV